MTKVVLRSFAGKMADKIRLVQLLVKYDQEAGLKVAKEKVDQLMAGKSVQCAVEEPEWTEFERELNTLKIGYEV